LFSCAPRRYFHSAKIWVVVIAAPDAGSVTFRDVTQQAGIRFVHNNGAFGKKFLPETMDRARPSLTTTTTAGRTFFS